MLLASHEMIQMTGVVLIGSRESSDRWVATVGRGGLMLGPPGEQTSGSLLYCERQNEDAKYIRGKLGRDKYAKN